MKSKTIITIILILVLLWLAILATNIILLKKDLNPIFVYPYKVYMDGGSMELIGLGYKINIYASSDSSPLKYYEIVPLWAPFDKTHIKLINS